MGDADVPDNASESPFLNDFTKVTVVFASGLNAAIMELSQAKATGAGVGAEAGAGVPSPPLAGRE